MDLLLDTCIVIWMLGDSPSLKEKTRVHIRKAGICYVSPVSAAEMDIKRGIGKLDIPEEYVVSITASGLEELPYRFGDAEALRELPYHHKDPFDRMLIAQAIATGLTILTDDRVFKEYNVPVLLNED